jgi:ATP-dependent DNA helicase RecQ
MNQQYKAGYLDKHIFDSLTELKKKEDSKFKIIGLLESVSTFDTQTKVNLKSPNYIQPLLAAANNIIIRGNPTICSRFISAKLSSLISGLSQIEIFQGLHLVDVRPNISNLYDEDFGSRFEKAFLNNFIPADKKYLTQFFQHQRAKGTLTNNGGDKGRVDFSFEIPYFKQVKKTTIYRKEKELKERGVLIIEVDGKRYHNALIDDIRDYETATFGHSTQRITEDNTWTDIKHLVGSLAQSEYFQVVETIRQKDFQEVRRIQTSVLTPIAIARIQRVINQYLISNYEEIKALGKAKLKIAIIERDVPCGHLAISDLNTLNSNLVGLENKQTFIPQLEATIFANKDFFNPDLQPSECHVGSQDLNPSDYDLIIDASMLWRTGIFKTDTQYASLANAIIIRSAHFTEFDCMDNILCSDSIQYRDLTRETGNEQHDEILEALPFIEYFLQNIFYKDHFRKGQLPILNRALKNKTVIGLLPTGGGKSLTYQLAAILQPGITIIIDPIRSLMVDQFEGLVNIGIDKCDFINSILTREEKVFVQDKILPTGKTQFLFCSPERLVIQEITDALRKTNTDG